MLFNWASPHSQIDQCYPCISSALEQMLSWYPNPTLHCMFHMQPPPQVLISNNNNIKFCPNIALSMLKQISTLMKPFQRWSQSKVLSHVVKPLSTLFSLLVTKFTFWSFTFFTSERCIHYQTYFCQKDNGYYLRSFKAEKSLSRPPLKYSICHFISPYTVHR